MAEITAAMVKVLRDETGQGMMECKKALTESEGDIEAAKDLLRARGMVKAEKKAGRATGEGLVALVVADGGDGATMVEVSSETDFCARNDVFKAMVADVARLASASGVGEVPPTDEITATVQQAFEKIGENMKYVRGIKLTGEQVGTYKHHNGKVGVIVAIEGRLDPTVLSELCMHVAFHAPLGVTKDNVPDDVVEREKAIAKAQAVEQGKPENIAEKMVDGKIRKFFKQHCLVEQPFIKDEDKTVKQILGDAKVTAFARYEVGQAASG